MYYEGYLIYPLSDLRIIDNNIHSVCITNVPDKIRHDGTE